MLHGFVFWIFVISGVVALIVWIAGHFRYNETHPAADRALDIINMRYANGEIGREQFEEMKREVQTQAHARIAN